MLHISPALVMKDEVSWPKFTHMHVTESHACEPCHSHMSHVAQI